jgi:Protein of unknown function (DUF3016)
MTTTLELKRMARRSAGTLALLVACATGHAAAAEGKAATGAVMRSDKVEVMYRDPAALTEVQFNPSRQTGWMDSLGRYIVSQGGKSVPAGAKLVVTITDVQLAGMYEPARRRGLEDVRIVRDTTPPRIDLSFQLVDAQGAVLKEGERKLRDIDFLHSSFRHRNEELRYEKNLIDDWMRKDFGQATH